MKAIQAFAILMALIGTNTCLADSTDIMERGRAKLVTNLIDAELTPQARLEKLAILKRDQMSIEQIVVREKYEGGHYAARAKMFANYDTYFIVHAAYEANRTLGEYWFELIGLTTESIRDAQVGSR